MKREVTKGCPMGRISGRAHAGGAQSSETKRRGGRPALHCFEINLLAGLLGERTSDVVDSSEAVGILLHHKSSVGGTQVEDHAGSHTIYDHGDPAVRTDLIGAIGCSCRQSADLLNGVERVCRLVPVKAAAGGFEESDPVFEGDIEAVHNESGLAAERGEGCALLQGESAILDCGCVVGEEVGAGSIERPENLRADGAAGQSQVDGSAAVGGEGAGAARDCEIGVHSRILHVVHGAGYGATAALDIAIAIGGKDARRVNTCRPADACVPGAAEYVRAGESGWRESASGRDLKFGLTDFERAASGVRHDIELARV